MSAVMVKGVGSENRHKVKGVGVRADMVDRF